jgi:hypothetical protein
MLIKVSQKSMSHLYCYQMYVGAVQMKSLLSNSDALKQFEISQRAWKFWVYLMNLVQKNAL